MNLFCSRDSEDEFLEAINTLEKLKLKQNEKDNEKYLDYNTINNSSKESKIIKEIVKKNSNEKAKNIKHKKKSTILEIIEYPYNENNKNNPNKKSKINSNITDINCETQLLIEYSNKYKENLYTELISNKNENKNKHIKIFIFIS